MAVAKNVVLITGGSNGIGLGTAKVFLDEGVKEIALIDLNESSEVQALREKYSDAVIHYINADITSEEQIRDAFKNVLEKFKRLDIVVHSAGIFNDKDWRKQNEVNVNGSVIVNLVAQEVMSKLNGGNGGTVLNLSSESALMVYPSVPCYSSTKSAILAMSRCFGTDLFYANTGVKVMAICPGATTTNMSNPDLVQTVSIGFDFIKDTHAELGSLNFQSPECVGKCIVKAIIDGENGSVWWARDGLPGRKVQLTATPVESGP